MTDSLPTLSRAAAAWGRFSYRESIVARGAVWTLVCWALGSGLFFLLLTLPEYMGASAEGSSTENIELLMPVLMVIGIGSPLISLVTGAALSGGAKDFLDSLKRGAKAAAFPTLVLLLLAAASLGSESEKAGLLAAIVFWLAVLTALTGVTGALLRRLAGLALGGRGNTIATRKAAEADFEFIYRAKERAYRANIEKIWGKWDDAWQRAELRKDFATGLLEVISCGGADAGYIYVCRYDTHVQLADIALLPEYQGKGIGTHLVKALLAEARGRGLPMGLGVFKVNPGAQKLYKSLGFVQVSEDDIFIKMRAA